mmetsp:Transcript_15153/g.22354  ORF Transcript_15153/g.22354 Transcript_15153/m.22354 type:complete len:236 (+) Transcript_15153:132-839(+)
MYSGSGGGCSNGNTRTCTCTCTTRRDNGGCRRQTRRTTQTHGDCSTCFLRFPSDGLRYLRFIKTRRWEYRMSRYFTRATWSTAANFTLLLCGTSTGNTHHLLLLPRQDIPTGSHIPRLNLLFRKGILSISQYVQIRAFWIVASHALDKRRTVFAGAVTRSNVAIIQIKPIQRQNASQCILLLCKCDVSGCARSSIVLSFRRIGNVVAIQHNLADFTVLTKIFRFLQQIFAGNGGR